MSERLGPLAFAFGVGAGIALGLALGAFVPSWGASLAFPASVLVLSIGSWKERDGEELTTLLRFAVGFTAGYLASAVPLTWFALDQETANRVAREVWSRWAVIGLALPGGVTTMLLRAHRKKKDGG